MEEEESGEEGLQQVYSKLWAKRVYDHTVPCLNAFGMDLIVPHTLVFSHGALQAWYFTTKDGSYRRKCLENNVHNDVMAEFCKNKATSDVVAQLTTQHGGMKVEYFTPADLRSFLLDPDKGCGVVQSFVPGEGDYLKSYQVLWTPVSAQIRSISSQHKAKDNTKPLVQRLGTYDAVDYVTTPLNVQISSHTHKVLKKFTTLLIERLNKIAELNQAEREHSHTKIIETVRYGIFNFRITDSRVYFLGNSELQICIMSFDQRSCNTGDMIVSRRVLKLEDFGKSKSFRHHPSLFRSSARMASDDYTLYRSENFSIVKDIKVQHPIERTAWTLKLIHKHISQDGGWRHYLKGTARTSLEEIKAMLFAANVFVTEEELLRFARRFTSPGSTDGKPKSKVPSSVPTSSLVQWIQEQQEEADPTPPNMQPSQSAARSTVRYEDRIEAPFPWLNERRRKILASMFVPTFQPNMCRSSSVPTPSKRIGLPTDNRASANRKHVPQRPARLRRKEARPRECQMSSSAYIHPASRGKRLEDSLIATAKKFLDTNVKQYLETTSPLVKDGFNGDILNATA